MKRYWGIIFFIFILQVSFILFLQQKNNHTSNKKTILIISNENEKDTNYFKYKQQAFEIIEKIYSNKDYKIKIINIDYSNLKDKEYIKSRKTIISDYIKSNKIIAVILGSTSIIAKKFINIIPKNIPIFSGAASIQALSKANSNIIFTSATFGYYNKGIYLDKLQKYLDLKNILFVMDENETYGMYIYESMKQYNNSIILLSPRKLKNNPKFYIKKYQDFLWVISYENSSKKILKFIKKYLSNSNLNIYPIYYASKSSLYDIDNVNLYTSTYMIADYKNFLDYDYLYHIKNVLQLKAYDFIFRNYYAKLKFIDSGLSKIDIIKTSIDDVRCYLFKYFKHFIDDYYIENKTKNVYKFTPYKTTEKVIYYNNIFKSNSLDKYLIKFNQKGNKILLPYQNIKNESIPVVYIKPDIKNISVTSLSTDVAEVDMILNIKFVNDKKINIQFGKDLFILTDTRLSTQIEYFLINTIKDKGFVYKTYRVKLFVPIVNSLFYFPKDKFWINIEFSKNIKSQSYLLYLDVNDKKQLNKIYGNVVLNNIYSTYSDDIYKLSKNKLNVVHHYYLLLEMTRDNYISVIIKYLLPALIIMFIALYVAFFSIIKTRGYDGGIGIVGDTILGVISVYFVFSLLISITNLILIDIIFYFIIFILSVTLIFLYRHKLKNSS